VKERCGERRKEGEMVFMHLHFDGPVFSGSAWKGWEVCFVSWHFTFRLPAYVVLFMRCQHT
jgi:hypothetical protein